MQVIFSPDFEHRTRIFSPVDRNEIPQLIAAIASPNSITPIYDSDLVNRQRFLDLWNQETCQQNWIRSFEPVKITTPQNSYYLIGARQKNRFSRRTTFYLMGLQKK